MIAILLLLPLYFWERAVGPAPLWNTETAWALAYVGIFPSVIAYTLYITGVARAGAAKAGLFIHLMPVFGTLLAMTFLAESFQLYHLLGIAAILCGLTISTRPSTA
ncbi:DMT family transporter [Methylobacillus glycogenes]|uniref:DMT family transporter n=1 Tax=Methylobacillus glycogenes TaxID=406 RepID=UPI001F3B6F74|nr:DMT family transporter [Methylobacillus glycogenes]